MACSPHQNEAVNSIVLSMKLCTPTGFVLRRALNLSFRSVDTHLLNVLAEALQTRVATLLQRVLF
jgi:hypothetical protein